MIIYADENIEAAIIDGLRRRAISVLSANNGSGREPDCEGSQRAKSYQVKQIRNVVLKYKWGDQVYD